MKVTIKINHFMHFLSVYLREHLLYYIFSSSITYMRYLQSKKNYIMQKNTFSESDCKNDVARLEPQILHYLLGTFTYRLDTRASLEYKIQTVVYVQQSIKQ